MPENPIVSASVRPEIKHELDLQARHVGLTRSALIAVLLEQALRYQQEHGRERFVPRLAGDAPGGR
jgi:antitoxin component of RelBE/YafQ-DinJ toxin-antitoxin module